MGSYRSSRKVRARKRTTGYERSATFIRERLINGNEPDEESWPPEEDEDLESARTGG